MQPVFWQTWMHHDCSKDFVSVVIPHTIFLLKFLSLQGERHRGPVQQDLPLLALEFCCSSRCSRRAAVPLQVV